MSTSHTFLNCM